jgi:hypothetical protein
MRQLAEYLTALEPRKWHQITMKMAWVYRTDGAHAVPPVLLAHFGGCPEPKAWDEMRRKVNNMRRAAKVSVKRAEERQKAERRRAYMRNYMRQRRAIHA